ncbi:MAG: maleylpyruvate isomerase N-terminal domain-containing protein [Pyrinomonadaceae bacterium]
MSNLNTIETLELYPLLDAKLIELLESLSPEEWHAPTVAGFWTVKDVAAHLLDGCFLRRLSIHRDMYFGEKPENIDSNKDLVGYLNSLNADWVKACKRLSPRILIDQLRQASTEVYEFFKTLDPHSEAIFAVSWAGENRSENWFDIARDYTERWHHQQQIRLAVGKFGIETRELYFPVLDTFMRALPYTYRNIEAKVNTVIQFTITGEAGGDWFLLKDEGKWILNESSRKNADAVTIIPSTLAWQLFTKGIDKKTAKSHISFFGDQNLGGEIINMLAVMA